MKGFKIHWSNNSEILIRVVNGKLVEIESNKQGLADLGKLLTEYSKTNGQEEFHIYPRSEGFYNGMLMPNSVDLSIVLK